MLPSFKWWMIILSLGWVLIVSFFQVIHHVFPRMCIEHLLHWSLALRFSLDGFRGGMVLSFKWCISFFFGWVWYASFFTIDAPHFFGWYSTLLSINSEWLLMLHGFPWRVILIEVGLVIEQSTHLNFPFTKLLVYFGCHLKHRLLMRSIL